MESFSSAIHSVWSSPSEQTFLWGSIDDMSIHKFDGLCLRAVMDLIHHIKANQLKSPTNSLDGCVSSPRASSTMVDRDTLNLPSSIFAILLLSRLQLAATCRSDSRFFSRRSWMVAPNLFLRISFSDVVMDWFG